MRCLELTEWGGELERTERAVPDVSEGEVLIEVAATGVGLTVSNVMNGDLGDDEADLPRIPGHEVVGRVVETGVGVASPDVDDLVAAYFYLTCDRCDPCLRGHESLCENLDGFVSVDVDGGFAEYVSLPAGNAIPVPDGLSPVDATAIPDAVATPYHVANQRANVEPGDRVLVLGAGGGVGIHLVQMAQYFGGDVTAVDRVAEKLDRCRELGAAHVVDTSERPLSEAVSELGVSYDAVVDFTGSTDLIAEAKAHLAPRGRLVNLTTFPGRSFDLSPREQVLAETEVVGSRYCSKYELRRAAALVADGVIDPVVTEVVEMDDVPDLLDRIRSEEVVGRGAMVPPE